jgi:hypothetical protein
MVHIFFFNLGRKESANIDNILIPRIMGIMAKVTTQGVSLASLLNGITDQTEIPM